MANDTAVVHERITTNPNVMAGKPVVKGTRVPVDRVLHLLEENDRADLFAEFARDAIERQYRMSNGTQTAAL